jgi:prepilin peptidase CpaA
MNAFHLIALGVALVAAGSDVATRRIPNALTFGAALAALAAHAWIGGLPGAAMAVAGWAVGIALFLPVFALGGMGAGDVKLLAGVGAWVWSTTTLYAFAVSTIVGAIIAVLMVVIQRKWNKHHAQFWMICTEILTVKDPEQLAAIAADRKPSMMLLPYGIPIAIGTIAYFAVAGMLL